MRKFYSHTDFNLSEVKSHALTLETIFRNNFNLAPDEPFTVDVLKNNKLITTLHFTSKGLV